VSNERNIYRPLVIEELKRNIAFLKFRVSTAIFNIQFRVIRISFRIEVVKIIYIKKTFLRTP
jgi:hypothetical protein